MKALLFFLILFSSSMVTPCNSINPDPDPEDPRLHWNRFLLKYHPTYSSPQEQEARFAIFKANLALARLPSSQNSAQYGVTQFSDMTPAEFSNWSCGGPLPPDDYNLPAHILPASHLSPAPDFWDWTEHGAVNSPQNQRSCGSCWAFSSICSIEGSAFINSDKLFKLSEQQLVDCGRPEAGCRGGWPRWAFQDLLEKDFDGRVDTESSYPYKGVPLWECRFDNTTAPVRLMSFKQMCSQGKPHCNEDDMKTWLFNFGPLSVTFNQLYTQSYRGGVINTTTEECPDLPQDHAANIVGYGFDNATQLPYWKVRNQYGPEYGEEGYFRIVRGKSACGINMCITIPQATLVPGKPVK